MLRYCLLIKAPIFFSTKLIKSCRSWLSCKICLKSLGVVVFEDFKNSGISEVSISKKCTTRAIEALKSLICSSYFCDVLRYRYFDSNSFLYRFRETLVISSSISLILSSNDALCCSMASLLILVKFVKSLLI